MERRRPGVAGCSRLGLDARCRPHGRIDSATAALDALSRIRSLALLCPFDRGAEAARLTPKIGWMGLKNTARHPCDSAPCFLQMLFLEQFLGTQNGRARLAARSRLSEETLRTPCHHDQAAFGPPSRRTRCT